MVWLRCQLPTTEVKAPVRRKGVSFLCTKGAQTGPRGSLGSLEPREGFQGSHRHLLSDLRRPQGAEPQAHRLLRARHPSCPPLPPGPGAGRLGSLREASLLY